jgi:hypothetical protein
MENSQEITTAWNNHGGRRSNAGRKPSGVKKKPVTIYVEQHIIEKYGRSEFREKLYDYTKTISNDIG